MSTRIRFFRTGEQARETERFLSGRGVKTFTRERNPAMASAGEAAFGFDLFVLRDEDVENARSMLEYEFGSGWGERPGS